MTVYEKLQALLTAANTKTGESDADLTAAVQTLIDGYGQGGAGVNTGTITPTARTTTMTIDIGISTLNGLLIVPKSATPLQSGGKTCIAVIVTPSSYFKYIAMTSNNAGSSWLTPLYSTSNTFTTLTDTEATVTLANGSGYFEDISYTWFAW